MPMPDGEAKDAYRLVLDGASAITSVEGGDAHSGPAYNLCGQRVGNMQKGGIYIVGGKKVMKR